MALTITNAQISTQEGSGAVVNQSNGAVITASAGAMLTVALQSTSGIQKWTLQFECPSYPALHQRSFDWLPGQFNGWQVPMPDYPVGGAQDTNILQGITMISTVSDASGGSVPSATYVFRTIAAAGATIQTLKARAVILSALSAYTNTNGTLTENSNGVFATTDGLTIAVGDRVFLPPGIAAAAADVGIYQVTSIGSAGSVWSMTRVSDMPQGGLISTGSEIHVTEGTLMAGTQWVLTTTGMVTIGTTTMAWFPRQVTQSVTLVAGTVTIANVPLVSATKCNITSSRTTANTSTATTGGYHPVGGYTAGALGTATFNFQATVAAGTINNADVSTLNVTVFNQV
jgi:hypothetical protein